MASMRRSCVLLAVVFFLSSVKGNQQWGEEVSIVKDSTLGSPWPLPQYFVPSGSVYAVDAENFRFVPTMYTCDILGAAFSRYRFLTFPSLELGSEWSKTKEDNSLKFEPHAKSKLEDAVLSGLSVEIKSSCNGFIYPSLGSDESYELSIDGNGANLSANTVWGGLRGLETFSQLVWEDDFQVYKVNYSMTRDFPRFAHRGTLLDTSRHYLSVQKIKEHLEAMAQNKMNVFHWHIVDGSSFPYESYTFPALSEKAAFTPGHVYTQEDVRDIIEFSRIRGIRVVPEYDSPGHTLSWGPGQPDLLTKCYSKGQPDGTFGPIDPSVNTTYTFLTEFFKEIATVYPDMYIHMGGDEVDFSCWKTNPYITKFMEKMKFGTDYSKLEQYYMQNLLNIINGLQKGYIIWQEVIDNGVTVRPDTVVEVWKGGYKDELAKVTKLGYHTLLSSCWYLNYISYGQDWLAYYKCDPQDFTGTDAQKKLVIGGETCMWGEFVDDTNLIPRFWPRASAVAERLWSAQTVTDTNMAARRISEHRCRLRRRGLAAEPINGPSFCRYEVPPRQ